MTSVSVVGLTVAVGEIRRPGLRVVATSVLNTPLSASSVDI